MPDRRSPEIGDAHLAAPAGDHLFGGFGEGRIVFLDVADRAEADADDTAKLGGVRELEQHPIDPVERRSEEHTSELQSLMSNSYAVFCLKKKRTKRDHTK